MQVEHCHYKIKPTMNYKNPVSITNKRSLLLVILVHVEGYMLSVPVIMEDKWKAILEENCNSMF